ncbi:MAG TPA: hypothetical protein DCZ03_00390, partial [Gammaproteobacteria bacterium]|nr:hypothetical protein [Gammaproteobacteria bacterium]
MKARVLFAGLFNFVIHRLPVLYAIGWLNRHFNFLSTVFVMYPASEEYAKAYVCPTQMERMRWSPWIVGLYYQNGKFGLSAVISSTERDFLNQDNVVNMKHMYEKAHEISKLVGATQVNFAGILPGVLNKQGISKGSIEAQVTVETVIKAEESLRITLNLKEDTPIILFGSAGFIGRRVAHRLSHRKLFLVDKADPKTLENTSWYKSLRGMPAILLNLASQDALTQNLPHLWREVVVLNEVYPEPEAETVSALGALGCSAYHIIGLRAFTLPSFPKAYKGGIP